MGNLLSSLYSKFFETKINIIMLGLDAAGKTAIIDLLKPGDLYFIHNEVFNAELIDFENFKIWNLDVGRCDTYRRFWKFFTPKIDGLIFVIDSHDKDRDEDALYELKKTLDDENYKECPILVFANKQDLDGSFTRDEIIEKFEMNKIKERPWNVQGCSGINRQGIKEGFDWIKETLNKNN